MCPWTAVQQDTQRLGTARGFGVLQSVGLAEMNEAGSAQAPPRPSPPCVQAGGGGEESSALTRWAVYMWASGLGQELRTFRYIFFLLKRNDVTLQTFLKKEN